MSAMFKNLIGNLLLLAFILVLPFSFLSAQETIAEKPSSPEPQNTISQVTERSNPFSIKSPRAVPGSKLKILVDKKISDLSGWKIDDISLIYATSPHQSEDRMSKIPVSVWYYKETDGELYLCAQIPGWDALKKIRSQSRWRGIFAPYRGTLVITSHLNNYDFESKFQIQLPDGNWAFVIGMLSALFLVIILSWGFSGNFGKNKLSISIKKLIISVKGNISVSKTQILIWTIILLFGIVYVYRVSAVFLQITPQILYLLGIGGGTAVAAKYNAVLKSQNNGNADSSASTPPTPPPDTTDKNSGNNKDSKPDIFKIQMLAFTIVIAIIVLLEITYNQTFPELPENLIVVMGISNAVYLGNKFSSKEGTPVS